MLKKTCFSFAMAMAGFSISSAAAQNSQPENEAKSQPIQPVNLNGLAKLSYVPSKERHDDWKAVPASWNEEFLLLVDQAGKPTYCEAARPDIPSDISKRLCDDLIANAKITILKGYGLGGREGIVAISIEPVTQLLLLRPKNAEFASPFSFVLTDLGDDEFLDYSLYSAEEAVGVRDDPTVMKPHEELPKYPSQLVFRGVEGATKILMGVSKTGEVISCRPIKSAGTIVLDATACKYALQNIKFEEVQGVSSADEPFYHTTSITWRINGKKKNQSK